MSLTLNVLKNMLKQCQIDPCVLCFYRQILKFSTNALLSVERKVILHGKKQCNITQLLKICTNLDPLKLKGQMIVLLLISSHFC